MFETMLQFRTRASPELFQSDTFRKFINKADGPVVDKVVK